MNKNILILGATGHLGKVLVKKLVASNCNVTALVRTPEKLDKSFTSIKIIKGSPTNENDVSKSLENIDVVISVLGHGFRTNYPIQEKTLSSLIPLMEKKKINRLITITGEALMVSTDKQSLRASITSSILNMIDPYRMNDAIDQQNLIEKSSLNWTVVRTPVHSDKGPEKAKSVGMNHPPIWQTINRIAVCNFIIDCIKTNKWVRQSPIIY